MAQNQPHGNRRVARSRILARRIVALVTIIGLMAAGYVAFNYVTLVSGITHVNALAPGGNVHSSDQNILLVGDDHRPVDASAAVLAQLGTTQDGGGIQTDTVMLLHVPANGQNPTVISFPRDTWVNVPGAGMHKLNAAFGIGTVKGGNAGGARLLVRTIQDLTGIHIDHFVRISLLGFYNVVNALGPVTVCLNHAVKDPYSGINLPAGVSTLNAQQALAFVRQRHGLARGDLDREARQQYFLSLEARNILTPQTLLNPARLNNVVRAVSGSIETDPGLNFLDLAAQVKRFGGHLQSVTIPILGTPTIRVGQSSLSIVQIDAQAMPASVAAIIDRKPASTTSVAVATPPSAISLTVLNGSRVNGAAARTTKTLTNAGFHAGAPATAPPHAHSSIDYPPAEAAEAATVASYLPGAILTPDSNLTRIEVVLGMDGVRATLTPQRAATSGATAQAVPKPATHSRGSCVD